VCCPYLGRAVSTAYRRRPWSPSFVWTCGRWRPSHAPPLSCRHPHPTPNHQFTLRANSVVTGCRAGSSSLVVAVWRVEEQARGSLEVEHTITIRSPLRTPAMTSRALPHPVVKVVLHQGSAAVRRRWGAWRARAPMLRACLPQVVRQAAHHVLVVLPWVLQRQLRQASHAALRCLNLHLAELCLELFLARPHSDGGGAAAEGAHAAVARIQRRRVRREQTGWVGVCVCRATSSPNLRASRQYQSSVRRRGCARALGQRRWAVCTASRCRCDSARRRVHRGRRCCRARRSAVCPGCPFAAHPTTTTSAWCVNHAHIRPTSSCRLEAGAHSIEVPRYTWRGGCERGQAMGMGWSVRMCSDCFQRSRMNA
jgi:hypothetical protein